MTDKLHEMINVRVTKAEHEMIKRRATARGQSVSAFIRDLVLDNEAVSRPLGQPAHEQAPPQLGPDVRNWRGNRIAHLTLVFPNLEQEQAYREWLGDPASLAAFRAWEEEKRRAVTG